MADTRDGEVPSLPAAQKNLQGQGFSRSCRLPPRGGSRCVVSILAAQVREEDHVADIGLSVSSMTKAVDADAAAARRGMPYSSARM